MNQREPTPKHKPKKNKYTKAFYNLGFITELNKQGYTKSSIKEFLNTEHNSLLSRSENISLFLSSSKAKRTQGFRR